MFYEKFIEYLLYILNFLLSRRNVMVVGDFNVSHKRIDHCDPDDVS